MQHYIVRSLLGQREKDKGWGWGGWGRKGREVRRENEYQISQVESSVPRWFDLCF